MHECNLTRYYRTVNRRRDQASEESKAHIYLLHSHLNLIQDTQTTNASAGTWCSQHTHGEEKILSFSSGTSLAALVFITGRGGRSSI